MRLNFKYYRRAESIKPIRCEECLGEGELYFSCCGDYVEHDTKECPTCGDYFQNIPEKCHKCDGEGEYYEED